MYLFQCLSHRKKSSQSTTNCPTVGQKHSPGRAHRNQNEAQPELCCCDMEIVKILNLSQVKVSELEQRTWLMYQPPVDSRP